MKRKIVVTAAMILAALSLEAQSVKVVSPNGGESWALNSAQAITWTATNAGTVKVDIVLRNAGARVGVIKSQVALAAGSWAWASVGRLEDGTMVPAGTDYTVRIRDAANTFGDGSDNAFAIAPTAPVFRQFPDRMLPRPLPLGAPKLAVTAINLVRNASGYGVVFGYKNTGTSALPKRHELTVKPDYRVLIDGREIEKGDLFIPESPPAGPGWELTTHSGGSVNFPVHEPWPWHIGKEITIILNERNALNMGSASKTSSLRPIALTVGYDLAFAGPAAIDWNANRARLTVTKVGSNPETSKYVYLNYTVGYYHTNTVSGGPMEATVTYPEGAYTKWESRKIPSTGPFPWHLEIPLEPSAYYDLGFTINSEFRDEFDERNNTLSRVRFIRPGTPLRPRITSMEFSKRIDANGKTQLRTTIALANLTNAAYGGMRLLLKRNGSKADEWNGIALAPEQKLMYINYGDPKGPSPYNTYNNFEALLYDSSGRLVDARSERQIGE
jgi:hypothetical protein